MDISDRIAKVIGALHIELVGKEATIEQLQAENKQLKDEAEKKPEDA